MENRIKNVLTTERIQKTQHAGKSFREKQRKKGKTRNEQRTLQDASREVGVGGAR